MSGWVTVPIREAIWTEKGGEGGRRVGEESLGDSAGVETGVEEGDAGELAVGRVFKGFGPENFGRRNRWFGHALGGAGSCA